MASLSADNSIGTSKLSPDHLFIVCVSWNLFAVLEIVPGNYPAVLRRHTSTWDYRYYEYHGGALDILPACIYLFFPRDEGLAMHFASLGPSPAKRKP